MNTEACAPGLAASPRLGWKRASPDQDDRAAAVGREVSRG
jgi:hypothetical protein